MIIGPVGSKISGHAFQDADFIYAAEIYESGRYFGSQDIRLNSLRCQSYKLLSLVFEACQNQPQMIVLPGMNGSFMVAEELLYSFQFSRQQFENTK
ncbi:hypothetical protein AZ34_13190 [Hylemonella gracilis str. Niagara R]|uniref:Uncharacterized protein n=1 Tax=Hylemonella gracilis str. Niagara R TaxID=1458275 RepID=A0A016XNX9_9BURK|nr:hypothetical protein AZ34_13190 [Hylemonella gracilis str. Niagara R]